MGLILLTADAYKLAKLRRRERELEIAQRQGDYIALKTRQSERGENPPETIESTDLLDTSMNWDYSPGWEDRRIAYVRSLRERGIPFRPSVRVRMPGGGVQNVYEGDSVDLEWFARGECCVRCCNWKSMDAGKHEADHRRLQDVTGVEPPQGVSLDDLCGFCGNDLGNQKYRTEAA
jgi:hypothetical protein